MKHDLFALTVSLDSLTSLEAAATLSIMASALPRYPRPQKRGIPLKTACMPFKFSTLPGWWRRRKTNETSGIMKGYRRKNKTINHSKKKLLKKNARKETQALTEESIAKQLSTEANGVVLLLSTDKQRCPQSPFFWHLIAAKNKCFITSTATC